MDTEQVIDKLEWIKSCADDTIHMIDEINNLIDKINEEGIK